MAPPLMMERGLATGVADPLSRVGEVTDILVVDDLPEKLLVYRTILENPALRIVTARSGQEALRAVLQGDFAVILLDVSMPDMDGFETAQLIRQRKRSAATPIIFLTAFTDDMRMAQGYASGAVDYIPTPVVPEILRAKVQVFVELFETRRLAAKQAEERARRTAAEASARRSAFLSATSTALSQALDMDAFMSALVAAPLSLAEMSLLVVMDSEKEGPEVRSAWTTPEGIVFASNPVEPGNWWMARIRETMDSGNIRSTTVPTGRGGQIEGGPDLSGEKALILPIRARDGVRGAVALIKPTGLDHEEPDLAREFASRAGIALENVLLVQGIREAHRRKDEFLAMLAHELRNPLAPMRNAVDLLELAGEQNPLLEEAHGVMHRQVTHMTRLVDDLLDATRIARGKVNLRMRVCDLREILRQAGADHAHVFQQAGIDLILELPESPMPVRGDSTRIAQCVGNLLHNAHKFTERGGRVCLRAQRSRDGEWIDVEVEDNGAGIDPTMLPYVFDQFRQGEQGLDRGRGGLGLGLTLVKGLVELHGGSISVKRSAPGHGAVFLMRLPWTGLPSDRMQAGGAVGHVVPRKILLIDDNTDATMIMRALLQKDGHTVSTADTGPQGVSTALDLHPDVIICDIGLPGMDGYEVARAILQQATENYRPILLALSGYGREEDQARSREAGFAMHLTKPVDRNTLRQVLARF